MYHNDEELGTLVHYYLAHEEERQTLAHKAHEIAVTGHSYAVRAAQVLSEAGYDA